MFKDSGAYSYHFAPGSFRYRQVMPNSILLSKQAEQRTKFSLPCPTS